MYLHSHPISNSISGGCFQPLWKILVNWCQLRLLFPMYGKIKNVPNHQSKIPSYTSSAPKWRSSTLQSARRLLRGLSDPPAQTPEWYDFGEANIVKRTTKCHWQHKKIWETWFQTTINEAYELPKNVYLCFEQPRLGTWFRQERPLHASSGYTLVIEHG